MPGISRLPGDARRRSLIPSSGLAAGTEPRSGRSLDGGQRLKGRRDPRREPSA